MKLISVEGIDRSGKTTLAAALGSALTGGLKTGDADAESRGLITGGPIAFHHEPSHDEIGQLFRTLSADLSEREYGVHERMWLALLSAADRHRQQPRLDALEEDGVSLVISDRYYLSGLAYHAADGIDPVFYQSLNRSIRRPDLYLYLDIDPVTAARRSGGPSDRWETRRIAVAVPAAYESALNLIKTTEGAAVSRIDASHVLPEVLADALTHVTKLFHADRTADC